MTGIDNSFVNKYIQYKKDGLQSNEIEDLRKQAQSGQIEPQAAKSLRNLIQADKKIDNTESQLLHLIGSATADRSIVNKFKSAIDPSNTEIGNLIENGFQSRLKANTPDLKTSTNDLSQKKGPDKITFKLPNGNSVQLPEGINYEYTRVNGALLHTITVDLSKAKESGFSVTPFVGDSKVKGDWKTSVHQVPEMMSTFNKENTAQKAIIGLSGTFFGGGDSRYKGAAGGIRIDGKTEVNNSPQTAPRTNLVIAKNKSTGELFSFTFDSNKKEPLNDTIKRMEAKYGNKIEVLQVVGGAGDLDDLKKARTQQGLQSQTSSVKDARFGVGVAGQNGEKLVFSLIEGDDEKNKGFTPEDLWKHLQSKGSKEGVIFDGGGSVDIAVMDMSGKKLYDGQGMRPNISGFIFSSNK